MKTTHLACIGSAKDLVGLPFCRLPLCCCPGRAERSSRRMVLSPPDPCPAHACVPEHWAAFASNPSFSGQTWHSGKGCRRCAEGASHPALPPSLHHDLIWGLAQCTQIAPSWMLPLASFHRWLCKSQMVLGSKGPAFGPLLVLLGSCSQECSLLRQSLWDARRGPTAHAFQLGHKYLVAAAREPFPSTSHPGLLSSPIYKSALR